MKGRSSADRRCFYMLKVFVIAKPCKRLRQSVFLFKGITDSFVLRTQNDKPFSHCNRRKMRGNPFP